MNIGRLSVILSASAAPLQKTLAVARSSLSSFFGFMGSILSRNAFTSLGKGLGGGLTSVFAGLKGSLIAGVGLNPEFWKAQIDKIKELGAVGIRAESLSVASDDYMALLNNAKRFGIEAGHIDKMLVKMGTMKQAPAGMDPEKWAEATTVMGRFGLLLDRGQAASGLERMGIAVESFGNRLGYKMMPMLKEGTKGLEAFAKKQRELGLAVSPKEMAGVIKARAALPKLAGVFEGFQTRMTVAFAPMIEVFANAFQKAMPAIMFVVDIAARGIAKYWEITGAFFEAVLSWIYKAIGGLLEWMGVDGWKGLSEMMPSIEDVVTNTLYGIGVAGAYVFDTIKAGIGGVVYAIGFMADKAGAIGTSMGQKWGKTVSDAGQGMMKWGAGAITSFGKSHAIVDKFFLDLKNRNNDVDDLIDDTMAKVAYQYQAVGAAVKGSKEALSIEARFKTGNLADPKLGLQKEQLNEAKKTNQLLQDLKQIGPQRQFDEILGLL